MIWQKIKFASGDKYELSIGDIRFTIIRHQREWQIGWIKSPHIVTSEAEFNWTYFISERSEINIIPALPDRSLVLKPSHLVRVMPKTSIINYIRIPIWVQFYTGAVKPENMVFEFPVEELSSTWFGEPDNGELAYSLPHPIETAFTQPTLQHNYAICPLNISNESAEILDFQRLLVSIRYLSIYNEGDLLCTNETKVRYKGEQHSNEVTFVQGKPDLSKNLQHLSSPRDTATKSILKKSFSLIKNLSNI
jgi:hypothetical protein